jgi:BMFP domain-containing protein YqiC
MSYGQLVTIESDITLDTSELDSRLDDLQQTIDGLNGVDEEKVQDMIDTAIDGRNLVSRDDVDIDNMETRVGDIDSLEERLDRLESATVQDGALAALEARIEALEGGTTKESFDSLVDRIAVLEARTSGGGELGQALTFFALLRNAFAALRN